MVLKAVVVGTGAMGKNHVRVLTTLNGVELVGIVDPDLSSHSLVRNGVSKFESVKDIPGGFADFAVIATPTSSHGDVALHLMRSGLHAFIEKPIADDVNSGRRIVAESDRSGLAGAVGHIERFNPAIQELRRRMELGEIGEVFQIVTRRQGSFPYRIGDVGVVKDLATHDIDLVGWITGSKYRKVYAQTSHRSMRAHEDLVAVTGTLESGVIVSHLVNWLSPMKERIVVVSGERGMFVADTLSGDLTLHENGAFPVEWDYLASFRGVSEGNVTRFAFPKQEPLISELEGFRDFLIDGTGQVVSLREGLEVLQVADAILRSARTGEVVNLA